MSKPARSGEVRPRFNVLAVDFPWRFGDKLPGENRGASKNYGCMTIEEGCTFDLPPIADDAIMFFWRVSSMVPEAYRILDAWGFAANKGEIVWNKLTKTGKKHFGMGRTVRMAHEVAIIATRGDYQKLIADKGVRSTFEAACPLGDDGRTLHSAKPDEFFALIERLTIPTARRVELFARRNRPGWTTLGDQVPDRIE